MRTEFLKEDKNNSLASVKCEILLREKKRKQKQSKAMEAEHQGTDSL